MDDERLLAGCGRPQLYPVPKKVILVPKEVTFEVFHVLRQTANMEALWVSATKSKNGKKHKTEVLSSNRPMLYSVPPQNGVCAARAGQYRR
jgi:hypothetical protein